MSKAAAAGESRIMSEHSRDFAPPPGASGRDHGAAERLRRSARRSAHSGRQPIGSMTSAIWFALGAILVSAIAAGNVVGAAALTGSSALAAAAGLLAAAISSLVVAILLRAHARRRSAGTLLKRPAHTLALFAAAAVISLGWLHPGAGQIEPEPVAGVQWLSRPDGARLAYHVTRAPKSVKPPIIVVHGGPGVADMAHDVPAFAGLARDRDVWIYDRAGTGASSRLADPTGYTGARAVEDLEAIRVRTGAGRVVLHGHSWGARIAVSYLQQYPDRVAALVLSAPGDLPVDGESKPGDLTTQLGWSQRLRLYARLARPRNLFTYALTAADLEVAHVVASDREMDRRFADIYADSAAALFCDDRLVHRVGTTGVGYYAHYAPQLHPGLDDQPADFDALRKAHVPVLIIKPACDYLPWSTAGYRRAFPHAQLVMLPDAGHAAYLERPGRYLELVDAFLTGRPLTLPLITGDEIPDGYRGTR
jgi:pimeloyl-ACP methyl ester carboxylesterase